jgi:hypothetical protein
MSQKARLKASEASQKSETISTGSLFLKGTFYGAVSIILLLNIVSLFLFEEKNIWIFWISGNRYTVIVLWRRQPLWCFISRYFI